MSQLKVTSIKGATVPASGPQIDIGNSGDINLNNSNVTNVTQATVTTANITTNNVTKRMQQLECHKQLTCLQNQFIVPTGTDSDRPLLLYRNHPI